MIQFLKPRNDRQRRLDVVEPAQMPLPDVIDWLAAAAEQSGLTDEEAAEIQVAFQQQSIDVIEPDEFSLDFGLESLTVPSLTAIEPIEVLPTEAVIVAPLAVDPLDLSQVELSEPLLELLPAPIWSDLSRSIAPAVALVDADALVEFRLDTCAVAALPAAPAIPMLAAATDSESVESADLAVDAPPIDWINTNWASEAVDVAAVEAAEVAATTSPLSYFQYYLDENAIGEGQAATDETPAPYVTPWRQPSMPGGLIGAGVLGATLVSGFVIADTVKTQPMTAVKRPTPTAPLQSLSAKDQPIATALPKVMPPEVMKPEVALPKPKSATMSQPMFPPLAPLGQSFTSAPLGVAIDRSSSVDLPQSNAGMGNGLSESPTVTARRTAPLPVAAGPSVDRAPLQDLTRNPELPSPPAPVISQTSPVQPMPETRPTSELPELKPDITVPMPETATPETLRPETSNPVLDSTTAPLPVSRITPSVLTELTPDPISSTVQRVNPAPAPIADVVVPTAAAPAPVVAPIADQSAALPSAPTLELPTERVFTREAAAAPSTMPPVALAQPIADRASRLPTQAQVQNLLAVPAVNAYVPMVAQWRPLTQNEASVAVSAQKLEGFTRQQLSPQDYRAAYQLVSEQADVLPSFGFIDYQRKLIILPPEPTTASNPIEHSRSFQGAAIIARRTTEL